MVAWLGSQWIQRTPGPDGTQQLRGLEDVPHLASKEMLLGLETY